MPAWRALLGEAGVLLAVGGRCCCLARHRLQLSCGVRLKVICESGTHCLRSMSYRLYSCRGIRGRCDWLGARDAVRRTHPKGLCRRWPQSRPRSSCRYRSTAWALGPACPSTSTDPVTCSASRAVPSRPFESPIPQRSSSVVVRRRHSRTPQDALATANKAAPRRAMSLFPMLRTFRALT